MPAITSVWLVQGDQNCGLLNSLCLSLLIVHSSCSGFEGFYSSSLTVCNKVFYNSKLLELQSLLGAYPCHFSPFFLCFRRSYHSRHQFLHAPQKTILDGELLWKYVSLSSKEKTDFAKQIGTSPGQVVHCVPLECMYICLRCAY